MGLRDKPCIPLTTAAIIDLKQQGGGYDNDANVGKAITYGRVFLQQLPQTLRKMVLVGLTDLLSITLILVRLDSNAQGTEDLSFDMSARLPDVKRTLLQLLSCEPQRWFVELPDLGPSIQIVGLLGSGATSHVYEAAEGGQQVVAKVPFIQDLSHECSILQSLQGIAGVPELLHNQCVGDGILMRPVLDPLTARAFFVHNLHNSLPSLVQTLKLAHGKRIINRDVRPSNLMHNQSTIFLVDWGSATLLQRSLYEGTIHYASLGVLQQLTQDLAIIFTGPADDLESLVASVFCISHPDTNQELQRGAKLPASVMQWWIQTWKSRPQWQLALTAARAANHEAVGDCLQALLE